MANSYDDFWYKEKRTSRTFKEVIWLGALFMFPAALTFTMFNQEVIAFNNALIRLPLGLEPTPEVVNLGVDVAEWFGLGDDWSYRINILFFQLGIAGSAVWWLTSALRLYSVMLANGLTEKALPIFFLFFGGLSFGFVCWYRLRIAGFASDGTPVAVAILLTAVILIAVVLYIDRKIRGSDDQAGA